MSIHYTGDNCFFNLFFKLMTMSLKSTELNSHIHYILEILVEAKTFS